MQRATRPGLILLFLIACMPITVSAQRARTQGLVLSAGLHAMRSEGDTFPRTTSIGVNGALGFGITRNFAVLVGVGVGGGADGILAFADIMARLNLPLTDRIALHAGSAFSAHGREAAGDRMVLGDGFSWSAGGEFLWLPHRSIEIDLTGWSGRYDEVRPDDENIDTRAKSSRLNIGINLRAPAR